ncbi:MAG: endonuclease/exonuclease/phosphatase family protein [Gemmatimonadota bacterium]|nr:MAG: endonuclease/exonuclease/phosphatase family protein [Gemmatimonadota bacterium]
MKSKLLWGILCILLIARIIPCKGQQVQSSLGDSLTVLTFNLHGWEIEWGTRLSMIVEELEELQPDLIGLQEVLQTPGTGGGDNSAKVIADSVYRRTGIRYEYIFERTHTGWGRYDEGLGIMTRHIILEEGVRDLPVGVFQRKALYCRILTPAGIVNFFDAHLSHLAQDEEVRVAQVRQIKEYVEEKSADGVPAANIVCGDFNAVPDAPPVRNMTEVDAEGIRYLDSWAESNPGGSGYTVPAESPNARIDYVFLRDGDKSRAVDSRLVLNRPSSGGIYPSDHIGVYSTFETTLLSLDVRLRSPLAGDEVSGQIDISWTFEDAGDSLFVTLFVSDDAGASWNELWSGQRQNNSYPWNTLSVPDGTQYKLRIVVLGEERFGMTESSGPFTVNNPGNAPPEIELNDPRGGELLHDEYEIRWSAADADGDPLLISLDVSSDDGVTWRAIVTDEQNDSSYLWDTRGMPNSPFYRLRLRCTDGSVEVADTSQTFTVHNERSGLPESIFLHIGGDGSGAVGGNIIDASQLTGHVYRITFEDALSEQKTYSVYDLDADTFVVRNAVEMDGVTEGPAFDGLRLVIFDYPRAVVDQAGTGWEIGQTNMTHTISLPELDFGTEIIRGYPYPADYVLKIYDRIVDTSSTFLGALAVPMFFTVWNRTEDRQVDIVFNEADGSGELSPRDEVYILEEKDQSGPFLTWMIFFAGNPSYTPPELGDEFVLATLKPFTHEDVFEFTTAPLSDKGDVNGDRSMNVLDVIAIVRHILEIESLTGSRFWCADCNSDGEVDAVDAVSVVNVILGIGNCGPRTRA